MANITVTNTNDSGKGSLRNAIAQAKKGDAITFAQNLANTTIELTSGQLFITQNLTIDGGTNNITISGGGKSRVIATAEGLDVTLQGLTIANGKAEKQNRANLEDQNTLEKGGGVFAGANGKLTIKDSKFINNSADVGGGIFTGFRTKTTVANSTFEKNEGSGAKSGFSAGAISTSNEGSLTVTDSKFNNNHGYSGGAIYNLLSELTVENSVFTNNTGDGGGGAIFTDGANGAGPNDAKNTKGGTIKISGSWFEKNTGVAQGGALYLLGYNPDTIIVENSTILNNHVTVSDGIAQGGGLRANGNVTISNVSFINNISDSQGGGLWLDGYLNSINGINNSLINVENSTFSGNKVTGSGSANGVGGAIIINPGGSVKLNVTNSTIVDNIAESSGGAFWVADKEQIVTITNSILSNNSTNGALGTGQVPYQLKDGGGNIEFPVLLQPRTFSYPKVTASALVANPLLGKLQQIGNVFVYPLLPGSPAINAGVAKGATKEDALGIQRDSKPDIGAFEYIPDIAGVMITETDGSTNVAESGATDSYSVVLKSQPTADVKIDIDSGNQITTSTKTLTFTAKNWNVAQNVTVSAVDDAVIQGDRTVTIKHTAINSNDGTYKNVAVSPINVKISDNDVPLAKNANNDVFSIKSDSTKAKLQVTLVGDSSSFVNELGVFTVDNAQGSINGIAPGAAGYAEAALSRARVILSSLSSIPNGFNANNLARILEFNSGDNLRFYLIKNSSIDAVQAKLTPGSNVLFSEPSNQKITDLGPDGYNLAWRDGSGNSVTDFKNLVVNIKATSQPLPLGTNLQGKPQGEVLDLRGVTSQVKAEFQVNREAFFNNFVGFYRVTDENGGIDTNGDGRADILPGQAGYTQAAVRGRIGGIDLAVKNQGTASFSGTFPAGSIFAPFMIVNGRPDAILDSIPSNDPEVYFPYLGANSDKADHIRLFADNVFGFEDQPKGGDGDFNDVIVRVNLSATT